MPDCAVRTVVINAAIASNSASRELENILPLAMDVPQISLVEELFSNLSTSSGILHAYRQDYLACCSYFSACYWEN
jgi:hypothetical protein